MKYDSQLVEVKNLLPTAKSILIALPTGADIDKLAAGLSLFLVLNGQGKEVTVVCEDTITVAQSHLFGVDHIQKNMPSGQGGNLTITLEGVASSNGTIPALEKLDWYAENNNLNLIFHVLPGQTFQPTKIVPHYQGSGFNIIFVIGAANLDSLGSIYRQNAQAFSGIHVVNIDNQNNTGFGQTNLVDTAASSVSEIVSNVITDLGFSLDADSASNILAGIFAATANLTDAKVSADTYMAVANCLRVGGRKPTVPIAPTQPNLSALIPPDEHSFTPPPQPPSGTAIADSRPITEYTAPSVISTSSPFASADDSQKPSEEERPVEEGTISETVEPEWLTPKIFKGTSLG